MSSLFKGLLHEMGSALMAVQLYPFGVFGKDPTPKRHSKMAINPRPVLLVHGVLHNRSAFISLKRRMEKLGWENIYTINYTTFHGNVLQMVEELGMRISEIMNETGATQIDIVAHSLGGIVSRVFMSLGEGRGKVRRLITLGTPHQGTKLSFLAKGLSRGALDKDLKVNSFLIKLLSNTALPKNSEIVSIYSTFDWTVFPGDHGAAVGIPETQIKNIHVQKHGHLGLLYSKEAFEAVIENILA